MATTIKKETLGLWKVLHNPDFNRIDFDTLSLPKLTDGETT